MKQVIEADQRAAEGEERLSVDGGETWQHMGLAKSQNVAMVRIHPTNPDLVFAAAFGHQFGPNPEHGSSTPGGGNR
jgi:hypothetical protein